jgi:hypothetical protein
MPATPRPKRPAARSITLLVATRKGLWTLASDPARNRWTISGPRFLASLCGNGASLKQPFGSFPVAAHQIKGGCQGRL